MNDANSPEEVREVKFEMSAEQWGRLISFLAVAFAGLAVLFFVVVPMTVEAAAVYHGTNVHTLWSNVVHFVLVATVLNYTFVRWNRNVSTGRIVALSIYIIIFSYAY